MFLAELSNHFSDLVESCSRRVLKCNDMHETRRRDIREHDEHKYLSDCHSALASRLIYDFKETHKWPSSAARSDYNFIAPDTHSKGGHAKFNYSNPKIYRWRIRLHCLEGMGLLSVNGKLYGCVGVVFMPFGAVLLHLVWT